MGSKRSLPNGYSIFHSSPKRIVLELQDNRGSVECIDREVQQQRTISPRVSDLSKLALSPFATTPIRPIHRGDHWPEKSPFKVPQAFAPHAQKRLFKVDSNENNEQSGFGTPFSGQDKTRRKVSLVRTPFQLSTDLISESYNDGHLSDASTSRDEIEESTFIASLASLNEIMSKSFDPKKAFDYNFINNMNAILMRMISRKNRLYRQEREPINFKLLAKSLEAGTKLYISKVEKIYKDTTKMSTFFDMATEIEQKQSDTNEHGPRTRHKDKRLTSRIVIDSETLNDKLQTELDIDPLFYKLLSAFNENKTADCLLMNNLRVNSRGVMSIDSNAILDCPNSEPFEQTNIKVSRFPRTTEQNCICRSFSSFEFMQRNVDLSQMVQEQIEVNHEVDKLSNYTFDVTSPVEDVQIGIEEMQFDLQDMLSSHNQKSKDKFEQLFDILPNQNDESNSFFNQKFLKCLYRKLNGNAILYNRCKNKGALPRRICNLNNYGVEINEELFSNINEGMIQYKTLKKWEPTNKNDCDFGFQPIMLRMPFVEMYKFKTFLEMIKARSEQDRTENITEDTLQDRNAVDSTENIEQSDITDLEVNQESYEQLEHSYIPSLDIPYAKSRLKLNFRSLKRDMWSIISPKLMEASGQTEILQVGDCMLPSTSEPTSSPAELSFDGLIHELSPNYQEHVHVSNHLVALLHLCNEQELQLNGGIKGKITICKNVK